MTQEIALTFSYGGTAPVTLHLHANADDALTATLQTLVAKVTSMSGSLDNLTQQVAASDQVMESAVTLIQGLAAKIQAAGTDPTQLNAIVSDLNAHTSALAAAVAANTPADPNSGGGASTVTGGSGTDTAGGAGAGGTTTVAGGAGTDTTGGAASGTDTTGGAAAGGTTDPNAPAPAPVVNPNGTPAV